MVSNNCTGSSPVLGTSLLEISGRFFHLLSGGPDSYRDGRHAGLKILWVVITVRVQVEACSDDDKPAVKQQFYFSQEAVSLKGANLYLVDELVGVSGRVYRTYTITDGTYDLADGLSLENYIDATYLIEVTLGATTSGEALTEGEYPIFSSVSDADATSWFGSLNFTSDTENYITVSNAMGGEVIVASGGFDDGDELALKFIGSLHRDDPAQVMTGTFYFKGTVQDERSVPE